MDPHEQWLKDRTQSIGGSEMGTILGLWGVRRAVEVWEEKVSGEVRRIDNAAMRRGKALEDRIATLFEMGTGLPVTGREAMVRHPFFDEGVRAHATLDGIIEDSDAFVYEAKSSRSTSLSGHSIRSGRIPIYWGVQLHHNAGCTKSKGGWLACLVGPDDDEPSAWLEDGSSILSVFRWEADHDLVRSLGHYVRFWWACHVEGQVKPRDSYKGLVDRLKRDDWYEQVSEHVLTGHAWRVALRKMSQADLEGEEAIDALMKQIGGGYGSTNALLNAVERILEAA